MFEQSKIDLRDARVVSTDITAVAHLAFNNVRTIKNRLEGCEGGFNGYNAAVSGYG